jgi:hypothetical protein
MAVRMLPWALGEAGYDLRGRTIEVDVIGAGEGTWRWGLARGEIPDADRKADGWILGRAPQLALVAARRLPVNDVLDSGVLVLGGDVELAEIVLRTMRAYV